MSKILPNLTYTADDFLSQVVREIEQGGKAAPSKEYLSQVVVEMLATVPWGHHVNILPNKTNPIGVAEYQLQPQLPPELKGKLPTAKQLAGVVKEVLAEQEVGGK